MPLKSDQSKSSNKTKKKAYEGLDLGVEQQQDDEEQELGRPSLLSGLNRPTLSGSRNNERRNSSNDGSPSDFAFEETLVIPARPRRLWKVSDSDIPTIPPFFPFPLNPRCCAYVADASPSVVAVRIAEALRQQSIAVEYDDENVTASCMTVDRCRFDIHLWQAKSPLQNATSVMSSMIVNQQQQPPSPHPQNNQPFLLGCLPPFALLVEFHHISGDVITFHNVISSLKKAAKSHGTGRDMRKPVLTSPMEYPRFVAAGTAEKSTTTPPSETPSRLALVGLERAVGLLQKDRQDAQLLGMEEILALSDVATSGLDIAMTVSLAVLGVPMESSHPSTAPTAATTLHQDWIYRLLVDRELPDEAGDGPLPLDEQEAEQRALALAYIRGFGGDHDASTVNDHQIEQMREDRVRMGDEFHGGHMRSMALRTLSNALSLLSTHNPMLLYNTLSSHGAALLSEELFQALLEDAAGGAGRPPGIVGGTHLASPHEAAIAIRCFRLLGQAHPKGKQRLIKHKRYALELLEKCYFVGQAIHEILEQEAKRTYRFLTTNT